MEHLSAVPLLADAVRPSLSRDSIVVAPDLGAVKLAQRYADFLDLPVAYVHKIRRSSEAVSLRQIVGEVRGRRPIVVDDMISTGGTMAAAVKAILEKGCQPQVTIAASHGLLVGYATKRLSSLPIQQIVLTDSVRLASESPLPLRIVALAKLLADAIRRLHEGLSLEDLLQHQ